MLDTAVDAGASILNIPDTVGYTTPSEFTSLITTIRERVVRNREVVISVHCHNDLGLAVANSLAAIEAGARQIECTINGIGERAGNASLEEIVMALRVRADRLPYETRIDTTELYPASQLLSKLSASLFSQTRQSSVETHSPTKPVFISMELSTIRCAMRS